MASPEGSTDIGKVITADDATATALTSDESPSPLPSWKDRIDISIAKCRKIRGSNYVQISTVNVEEGAPRCRTVVFRGFQKLPPDHPALISSHDGSSCVMKMITDRRSRKVQTESRQCELVWWFSKSSEQYRIRGDLLYVGPGGDEEEDATLMRVRKEQWGNLSDPAREQFFWDAPGVDYTGEPTSIPVGGRDEEGSVVAVPDTFLLMLLLPKRVDYLKLGDNYHQIDELVGNQWTQTRVNP